jgi:GTP cyclohydrolase II
MPDDADATWLSDMADPARDLMAPMKGPLQTVRDGDATLHRLALLLAKSAQLLPCVLAVDDRRRRRFRRGPTGSPALPPTPRPKTSPASRPDARRRRAPADGGRRGRAAAHLPPRQWRGGTFRDRDRAPRPRAPVLARLHSACFTGDVLGSLKCDCGPQLRTALAEIGKSRRGRAALPQPGGARHRHRQQDARLFASGSGFDTVEANHRLGFEDDERDFRIGADILRRMGFGAVRLMTNNPRKVEMMEAEGDRRDRARAAGDGHEPAQRPLPRGEEIQVGASSVTPADMVLTPMGLRFHGRLFPAPSGAGGMTTDKREGDGATPAGVHRIIGCLYRPDRMARPLRLGGADPPRATCGPTTRGRGLQPHGARALRRLGRAAVSGRPAL